MPSPEGVRRCRALLLYAGTGRELVARLKYRNGRSVLGWLAAAMAALVPHDAGEPVDVVTWAPTTDRRVARRGFDQAELLARGVATSLGLPCQRLLRRRPGPAQTGQDASSRRAGPSFTASADARGRAVLVVDDVVTTGATLAAAARALYRVGATDVSGLAAARTPLKVSGVLTDA